MPVWLSVLLEIIKITVPALIVFFTVYKVLQTYLDNQLKLKQMEIRQNAAGKSLPLQLQAYERLSMFCERITIPNLLLRLRKEGMSAKELKVAMLLTIQQEFEYNITQQVYVSDNLWKIIQLARDEAVTIINEVHAKLEPDADGKTLAGILLNFLDDKETALDKAQQAIKKEAGTHLT